MAWGRTRAERERKIEVKGVHRAAAQLRWGAEAGRASGVCKGASTVLCGQQGSLGPSRPPWPRRYRREKWHLQAAGHPRHSRGGREGPAGHPCGCPGLVEGLRASAPSCHPEKELAEARDAGPQGHMAPSRRLGSDSSPLESGSKQDGVPRTRSPTGPWALSRFQGLLERGGQHVILKPSGLRQSSAHASTPALESS